MRKQLCRTTLVILLIWGVSQPSLADHITVLWAGDVQPSSTAPGFPENALGAPDGNGAVFNTVDAEATYQNFDVCVEYEQDELADLLGVTLSDLGAADFLAIERNGSLGFGFEASAWAFSENSNADVVPVPSGAFVSGAIGTADYLAFFGLSGPPGGEWPFFLAQLPTVDRFASDFTVTVTRQAGPLGSPDPDAMGVLSSAPCPLDHFVCYSIKGARKQDIPVEVKNQFGTEAFIVDKANLLCVPSTKRLR